MRRTFIKYGLILIIAVFVFSLTQEAWAIPTFSRKYRTSCTTCHIGFNKLNPFGEAYRLNGYEIPQAQEVVYVKEEPVSLGAPAWKKVWPEGVWPGAIPQTVPISFLVHQRVNIQKNDGTATANFQMPHEFELIAGGTLGKLASFYGKYVLDENGGGPALEQMYIQFNDLFTGELFDWFSEDAFNLKIGRFHVAAEPFHDPTRRTLAHPRLHDFTVGGSSWNLRDLQAGFEANGVLFKRLRYAVGVVNGNGSVEDDNDEKDTYYRLAYKCGGMAFDGSGEDFEGELKQTENWIDNAVTIGTFGYFGHSNVSTWENEFYRVGVDVRVDRGDLDLFGAWVYGLDHHPSTSSFDVDSFAWYVEGDYVFYPWLIGALRYEQEHIGASLSDLEKLVANLVVYARANLRFALEGTYSDDGNHLLQADLTYLF